MPRSCLWKISLPIRCSGCRPRIFFTSGRHSSRGTQTFCWAPAFLRHCISHEGRKIHSHPRAEVLHQGLHDRGERWGYGKPDFAQYIHGDGFPACRRHRDHGTVLHRCPPPSSPACEKHPGLSVTRKERPPCSSFLKREERRHGFGNPCTNGLGRALAWRTLFAAIGSGRWKSN